MTSSPLRIENWGLVDYDTALKRQQDLQRQLISDQGRDTLVLVEHLPVVTLGLRGGADDLRCSEAQIGQLGVGLHHINRGGFATAHEPGQMVAYPIVRLKKKDLRWYSQTFLRSLEQTLADYDLAAEYRQGEPGLWVNDSKIASFGIAVKKWVSSHGIALNVNNDLTTFNMIVPCGKPTESVTSMARELDGPVDMSVVVDRFVDHFCRSFAYIPEQEIT